MKRYIKFSDKPGIQEYVLKIVVEIGPNEADQSESIAASGLQYLREPNLKEHLRLDSMDLEKLDSVIGKVLALVKKYEFHLISHKQSPKSYAYYIRFIPTDANGDEWEYPASIQFELRDHSRNDGNGSGWVSVKLYVQVFKVGDKTCFSTATTIAEVRKVLNQLKKGDYSSLQPIPAELVSD